MLLFWFPEEDQSRKKCPMQTDSVNIEARGNVEWSGTLFRTNEPQVRLFRLTVHVAPDERRIIEKCVASDLRLLIRQAKGIP
jgi:hypothetical protein